MRGHWLLIRDFNEISYVTKKKRGVATPQIKFTTFKNKISECELQDLGASGPKFTWKGLVFQGGQHIYERLDKDSSNEDWRVIFHEAHVKVLSRDEFSDHHPIMVSLFCNVYSRVTKHFRFESAWMTSNNYFEMVKGLWKDNDGLDVNLRRIEEDTKA